MVTGSIGERVAAYRRRRGLSKATLAGLVGPVGVLALAVGAGMRSLDRLLAVLDDVPHFSGRMSPPHLARSVRRVGGGGDAEQVEDLLL